MPSSHPGSAEVHGSALGRPKSCTVNKQTSDGPASSPKNGSKRRGSEQAPRSLDGRELYRRIRGLVLSSFFAFFSFLPVFLVAIVVSPPCRIDPSEAIENLYASRTPLSSPSPRCYAETTTAIC